VVCKKLVVHEYPAETHLELRQWCL
jgi:hypothetical protein